MGCSKKKKAESIRIFGRALLLGMLTFLGTVMLAESGLAVKLACRGLNLWFNHMIPVLLPFMILSGLLIRLRLSDSLARLFAPLLRPLFGLSDSCLYVIIIGFLCGFPMGARAAAESLDNGRISLREASLLLSFCNNIGPVYFTGFVLSLFQPPHPGLWLTGMYLLPLLYGIFLRRVFYRDLPRTGKKTSVYKKKEEAAKLRAATSVQTDSCVNRTGNPVGVPSFFDALQDTVISSLTSMAALGGYMIFFNLLNLIPELLLPADHVFLRAFIGCLLEITSGLTGLGREHAFWALVLLPFGGISCLAQTGSMIHGTKLSLKNYAYHKMIQTAFAFVYCTILKKTGLL